MKPAHPRRCAKSSGLVATAVLAGLGVLAGCGLPTQQSASPVPANEVPAALFASPPTTLSSPPTTVRANNATPTTIYFLGRDNLLAPVVRQIRTPPTAQAVLLALEQGTTTNEYKLGAQSAIPAGTQLAVLGVRNKVATVALDASMINLGSAQTIDALAQIVYSLTSLRGITGVAFVFGGAPIPAEIGGGQIVYRAVVRKDYEALVSHA